MSSPVEVIELKQSIIETYVRQSEQSSELEEKCKEDSLLILPRKYEKQGYCFASHSVDFVKFCRSQNADVEILSTDDFKVLDLHSFDIWMPIIYVAEQILLPLAISLVANFISSKKKGREHEKARVNVDIVYKKGKKEVDIHYDGDADTFKEVMDKLELK